MGERRSGSARLSSIFKGGGFGEEPAPFCGLFFFVDAFDQFVGAFLVAGDGGGDLDEEVEEVHVILSAGGWRSFCEVRLKNILNASSLKGSKSEFVSYNALISRRLPKNR